MQEDSVLTICPSFSSYSSIANKVFEETTDKTEHFVSENISEEPKNRNDEEEEEEEEQSNDDGFEFDCVFTNHEALTITADEMFSNGKIRPIFPIFQQDLEKKVVKSSRHTLIKLLNEERESSASSSFSSESESDIVEEAVPGTFCTWKPKSDKISLENKKNRTSKRWKLKDLIQYGGNSESKESSVILSRSSTLSKSKKREEKIAGKVITKAGGEVVAVKSAHELHYVRNRELKEVDKRRSYLPYRKDLVGFFANVNGLSRHLHPL
ncbi:hypothetical protein AQUCO_02500335v1 [Aquilegia coerulea]|uniref:Uncharacterized protein n=1 Tax=Aquilegia coerulea TaxID=218851 RepID=A0A2G5DAK8_AQUCA|nr:hypothetical protein AQUCO_02500335v1 [Aquilegia coerulea]